MSEYATRVPGGLSSGDELLADRGRGKPLSPVGTARRQPGGVGEQVLHRDLALLRGRVERLQVLDDAGVEGQGAVDEQRKRDRQRRDDFGERRQVEERVGRNRLGRVASDGEPADLEQLALLAVAGGERPPRKLTSPNGSVEEVDGSVRPGAHRLICSSAHRDARRRCADRRRRVGRTPAF
jgi:hypothetical protein